MTFKSIALISYFNLDVTIVRIDTGMLKRAMRKWTFDTDILKSRQSKWHL